MRIVGDHQKRDAALGVQAAQQHKPLAAGSLVQIAGRLIGQHQRRVEHHRACNRHTLLPPESSLINAGRVTFSRAVCEIRSLCSHQFNKSIPLMMALMTPAWFSVDSDRNTSASACVISLVLSALTQYA